LSGAKGIKDAAKLLEGEECFAFDTETAFFGRKGPRDHGALALLQFYLPKQNLILLVDPAKSIDEDNCTIRHHSLNPLKRVFADPSVTKIAHSAGFDQKVLDEHGFTFESVVDTQTTLKSLRPEFARTTLKAACRYLLGIEVDKELQTSKWHKRPLGEDQIRYAGLDPDLAYRIYEALRPQQERVAAFASLNTAQALHVLNQTKRELDFVIRKNAPELEALESSREAIAKELARRFPGGSEGFTSADGDVSAGKPKREINPAQLIEYFGKLKAPAELKTSVVDALREQIDQNITKDAIVAVAREIGFKEFGFSSEKKFRDHLATFKGEAGNPRVSISTKFTPAEHDAPSLSLETEETPVLMKRLNDVSIQILELFRTSIPLVPKQRAEISFLEKHLVTAARAEVSDSLETADGTVTVKAGQASFDWRAALDELPKLLKDKTVAKAFRATLDAQVKTTISKAAVEEVLERPEFLALGLDSEDAQQPVIDAVSVPVKGYYPTKVYPSLVMR
jgi:hypothetical protein